MKASVASFMHNMRNVKFEAIGRTPQPRRSRLLLVLLLGLTLGILLCQPLLAVVRQVRLLLPRGSAATSPLRVSIRGKHIFLPGESQPAVLRGFNMMFKRGTVGMDGVLQQDRELTRQG